MGQNRWCVLIGLPAMGLSPDWKSIYSTLNMEQSETIMLFSTSVELGSENVCLSVCLSVTNFGAAYLVLMTFPKLNSSVSGIFRVIPRWYFFVVAQF